MKLKQVLILGFSAGIVGILIANLFFHREGFYQQIIINGLSVTLTSALFFLIYFKVRKKSG